MIELGKGKEVTAVLKLKCTNKHHEKSNLCLSIYLSIYLSI